MTMLLVVLCISSQAQKGQTERNTASTSVISPQQSLTGEVVRVDRKANTFTAKGKDFEFTINTKGPLPAARGGICLCSGGDASSGHIYIGWGKSCPCSTESARSTSRSCGPARVQSFSTGTSIL
jgi:hypothetical protein